MRTILLVLLMVAVCSTSVINQENICNQLNKQQLETYNFKPSKIDYEQYEIKKEEISAFWTEMKDAGKEGIECLKKMLIDNKDDDYFFCEGSYLLFSLDQSDESIELIKNSLRKIDLKKIQKLDYINILLLLSNNGVDIGELAEKYMIFKDVEKPAYSFLYELDRISAGVFLYGSMPCSTSEKFLTELMNSKKEYARTTASILLAMNLNENSLRILDSLNKQDKIPKMAKMNLKGFLKTSTYDPKFAPKYTRDEIIEKLKAVPDFSISSDPAFKQSAIHMLMGNDMELVREARRKCLYHLSDERLYDYYSYSGILNGIIYRLKLYQNYMDIE
ncbi:hypothetical protein ACFLQG_01720 [Candidatus Zixiibacteriota bacterium]